jgi:hypothetical protein
MPIALPTASSPCIPCPTRKTCRAACAELERVLRDEGLEEIPDDYQRGRREVAADLDWIDDASARGSQAAAGGRAVEEGAHERIEETDEDRRAAAAEPAWRRVFDAQREKLEAIIAAHLPIVQGEIARLFLFERMSQVEIARLRGTTKISTHLALHAGVARLIARLVEDGTVDLSRVELAPVRWRKVPEGTLRRLKAL